MWCVCVIEFKWMKEKEKLLTAYIGKRLSERRKKLGLSLREVGEKVSVSPQQIQKYECGPTQLYASRLYQLSTVLGVEPVYFFNGFLEFEKKGMPVPHTEIFPDRQRALHVLLIEDDEGDAYLIQRAFEISAVNVQMLVLHESNDVLLFLRNQMTSIQFPRPDLILLDLYLPKKDGFSLLRDIKYDRTLSDIPVVIVTNSMRAEDILLSYQEHASGYICKSFDFDEFTQKFDEMACYWSQTVILPNRQQEAVVDSAPVSSSTFAQQDYGTQITHAFGG